MMPSNFGTYVISWHNSFEDRFWRGVTQLRRWVTCDRDCRSPGRVNHLNLPALTKFSGYDLDNVDLIRIVCKVGECSRVSHPYSATSNNRMLVHGE